MKSWKRILAAILCVCLLWTAGLAVVSYAAEEYPPNDVTSVSLDKKVLTLKYGESYTFKLTYAPTNATNAKFVWSSSNDQLATVDASGKVTIAAAKDSTSDVAQTVTITVCVSGDSSIKDTCVITVTKDIGVFEMIGRIFNSLATLFTTLFTNKSSISQIAKIVIELFRKLIVLL